MELSRILIWTGLALLGLGVILTYAPGLLNWFGRLPGDVRIEKERSFVFFPITSMLIISIVLTVVANLFAKK